MEKKNNQGAFLHPDSIARNLQILIKKYVKDTLMAKTKVLMAGGSEYGLRLGFF